MNFTTTDFRKKLIVKPKQDKQEAYNICSYSSLLSVSSVLNYTNKQFTGGIFTSHTHTQHISTQSLKDMSDFCIMISRISFGFELASLAKSLKTMSGLSVSLPHL